MYSPKCILTGKVKSKGADMSERPMSEVEISGPTRRQALGTLSGLSGLVGWLGLTGSGPALAAPALPGQPVAWPAAVRLLDGTAVTAGDLAGVATVVVFFSTDCPFCKRHNQHVERLHQAARGQPLRIIAAAQDRDPAVVQAYLARNGLGFAATLDAGPLHEALSSRRVIPLTCVVDRRGVLREVIPGEMFEDDVLGLLKWTRA